tara:strand:- start:1239 stop:1808 length:570 start_codon:yes stop_codon:yes gene_type:complete
MSAILDNLNKQYTDTQALIVLKNSAITSAHNSVLSWKVEAKRLKDRYEAMGWTVSANTKLQAKASWDNAESKVSEYALVKTNRTLEKNTLNALLVSIQANIDDYHEAIEISLAKGIPEEGSVEIADEYVQAEMDLIQAELDQANAQAQADLDNTTGKTTNRKIFIAIGVVVALMLIWFLFKKIKKSKIK